MVKNWSVIVVLAVAALVVPMAVVISPGEASSACTLTAELIGLHGLGEGPSPQDPGTLSPTIEATFDTFTANAPHSAWEADYMDYPTIPADWTLGATIKNNVQEGVKDLENRISESISSCPHTPISLVGYSEGALIINNWMQAYNSQLNDIRAVELYGDPCLDNPYGTGSNGLPLRYRGLARIAIDDGLPELGLFLPSNACGAPEPFYPYPGIDQKPMVQSLCIGHDPICGQLYPEGSTLSQATDAKNCTQANHCTHLDYVGAATTQGGKSSPRMHSHKRAYRSSPLLEPYS